MFLKVWEGRNESPGHNNGHPETKTELIKTIEHLHSSYDPAATYYKCTKVHVGQLISILNHINAQGENND